LRWIFREENFSRPFAAGRRRRDRIRFSYDAEAQYGSSSKPNSFSAFLQSIAVDMAAPSGVVLR
jgi:hypothetical protein